MQGLAMRRPNGWAYREEKKKYREENLDWCSLTFMARPKYPYSCIVAFNFNADIERGGDAKLPYKSIKVYSAVALEKCGKFPY